MRTGKDCRKSREAAMIFSFEGHEGRGLWGDGGNVVAIWRGGDECGKAKS